MAHIYFSSSAVRPVPPGFVDAPPTLVDAGQGDVVSSMEDAGAEALLDDELFEPTDEVPALPRPVEDPLEAGRER